jgi:hypothetical protein
LDALKAEAADTGQGFYRQGFGKPGDAFNNGVASGNENEEELIDDFTLADDYFRKFAANLRCECGKVLHG